MHWSLGGLDSPLDNGQKKSSLQHLESCTGVWVDKTPPLLMGRGHVVSNIWSNAIEFRWVKLLPCYGQERTGLQHLESCTGVWVGKITPLFLSRREVV